VDLGPDRTRTASAAPLSFNWHIWSCQVLVVLSPRSCPRCRPRYQKSTELLIRKLPFQRLVREIAQVSTCWKCVSSCLSFCEGAVATQRSGAI
jgi:hypothetical protein